MVLSLFRFNKPHKRFDPKKRSFKILRPTKVKRIVRRTYMRTVTKKEKEEIIKELLKKQANGITERECQDVLQGMYFSKKISRQDYDSLIRVFKKYYK